MVYITVVDDGITEQTGVHDKRRWCASPARPVYITDRAPGPAAGSVCITEPNAGVAAATGVHHRTEWCALPNRTRASPERGVCIADVDGVHHRPQPGTHKPGSCTSPNRLVYIAIGQVYIRTARRCNSRQISRLKCTRWQCDSHAPSQGQSRVDGRSLVIPRTVGHGTRITRSRPSGS
jgi:hypothetical protein